MAWYRVGSRGFPVADALIPAGTEVNTADIAWRHLANLMPPIGSTPLDQATYEMMRQHYTNIGYGHLLGPPPPVSKSI